MSHLINQTEMRAELRRQVDAAGGLMVWCRMRNLTHAPTSLILNGHRPVSEPIANACGFLIETVFRRIAA